MIHQQRHRQQRLRFALELGFAAAVMAVLASCGEAGHVGRPGWSRAWAALEMRCQAGDMTGCRELGVSLLGSDENRANVEAGIVLLEVACGQKDALACQLLGIAYAGGPVESDRARGRDLLRQGCVLGAKGACLEVKSDPAKGGRTRCSTLSLPPRALSCVPVRVGLSE